MPGVIVAAGTRTRQVRAVGMTKVACRRRGQSQRGLHVVAVVAVDAGASTVRSLVTVVAKTPPLIGGGAGDGVGATTLMSGRARLLRYVLRPPFAQERLAVLPDQRVRLAYWLPRSE
jgi:hypothetical protein